MLKTTTQTNTAKEFPSIAPIFSWFVVYTKAQAEKKFAERLQHAGYEVYLPLQEELKQWSDRKKKIQKPLISSVVFVCCTEAQLSGLYNILGFSRVLRYLGKPAVVQPHHVGHGQRGHPLGHRLGLASQPGLQALLVSTRRPPGSGPCRFTAEPELSAGGHPRLRPGRAVARARVDLEPQCQPDQPTAGARGRWPGTDPSARSFAAAR